ncbi:hypothetical protein [Pontibacter oryzae]|uniref:Uncharacterized protein n=1 Tax=Pontibacter oryzae TaxID=2304593 RepID=A0A399SE89_9BACT|nr:hypothetical protein [Pontibacter oryzae]RIJ41980.1 hypothetical protein D1627_08240 [Pontibacter oryzae]
MKTFNHTFYTFFVLLLFTACSNQKQTEREQALADYRNFVTAFEQDSLTETEMRAMSLEIYDSTEWANEKERLMQTQDSSRAVIETSLADLKKEQQTEVQDLDQRFDNAMHQREQQYRDVSHRYALRRKLLGLEVKKDDLSDITSHNIEAVYDRFVGSLSADTASYQARDWDLIEGWWLALNSRYRTLEQQLSGATKKRIQENQQQYQRLRSKTDIDQV